MSVRILQGDARTVLQTLPDESVHCVVTSPPYWGLRDYGHDGQIGLEESPQAFVAALIEVLDQVRRVLRADGTLWLNLGDTYAADRGGTCMPAETLAGGVHGKSDYDDPRRGRVRHGRHMGSRDAPAIGLKHKDLVGVPWRVAFAAQASGWYLRQDIIWSKPNPMPESVRDRCTKAHEYIFMLSKSERYYYDQDAIKVPASLGTAPRADRAQTSEARDNGVPGQTPHGLHKKRDKQRGHGRRHAGFNDRWDAMEKADQCSGMVNKRSVWTVATHAYAEAHFATFPPDLIEPCILAGCPEGGLVLDPFGGAGTTGLVADRLQRDAILIELNPEYAALAEKRIRGDSPLFAEVA